MRVTIGFCCEGMVDSFVDGVCSISPSLHVLFCGHHIDYCPFCGQGIAVVTDAGVVSS